MYLQKIEKIGPNKDVNFFTDIPFIFTNNIVIRKYLQPCNFPHAILPLQKEWLLRGVAIKKSSH